jgi:hypothetical protein
MFLSSMANANVINAPRSFTVNFARIKRLATGWQRVTRCDLPVQETQRELLILKVRPASCTGSGTSFVVRRGGEEKGELMTPTPLSNLDPASSARVSGFALMLNMFKKQSLLRSRDTSTAVAH